MSVGAASYGVPAAITEGRSPPVGKSVLTPQSGRNYSLPLAIATIVSRRRIASKPP
jgi:hypothetical protein